MIQQKGSILIFTIWVLVILAIFSVMLSARASSEISLAKYESNNIRAGYLAKAGVMKALAELVKEPNAYRRGIEPLIIGKDKVEYSVSDEGGRLNLNNSYLTETNLERMETELSMADKILKYKADKISKKGVGFEFMEELFLADDTMTKDIYSDIKDSVTIYGGANSKVNINTAGEKVLYAMTGDQSIVDEILEERKGVDGEEGTEDDGIKNISDIQGLTDQNLFTVEPYIFRVSAKVFLSGGETAIKISEAVIDKSGKIYYWKEE